MCHFFLCAIMESRRYNSQGESNEENEQIFVSTLSYERLTQMSNVLISQIQQLQNTITEVERRLKTDFQQHISNLEGRLIAF